MRQAAAARARAGWAAESESSVAARLMDWMAVSRAAGRIVRRAAERPSESIVAGWAAAERSGFFRARSHCAKRACTSASTHSSKNSCSSLRRLATLFKTGEMEGLDGSFGRSEEIFERPVDRVFSRRRVLLCIPLGARHHRQRYHRRYYCLEYGLAVPGGERGARLVVSTNAEMGWGGRRVTDKGAHEATVVGRDERAPDPGIYDLRLELRRPRLKSTLLKARTRSACETRRAKRASAIEEKVLRRASYIGRTTEMRASRDAR